MKKKEDIHLKIRNQRCYQGTPLFSAMLLDARLKLSMASSVPFYGLTWWYARCLLSETRKIDYTATWKPVLAAHQRRDGGKWQVVRGGSDCGKSCVRAGRYHGHWQQRSRQRAPHEKVCSEFEHKWISEISQLVPTSLVKEQHIC